MFCLDSTCLANAFNDFFNSKIEKIHTALMERAAEVELY